MIMLVIAAHPDDEVLGCGGYMARFSAEHDVYTAIVTEGCSAQYNNRAYKKNIEKKKNAAIEANQILGGEKVFFGNFPDMKLDIVKHIEINKFLEDTIKEITPDIILTHHPGDVNIDHQLVYKSTMVACRPANNHPPDILLYETPSATEWQSYDSNNIFIPNVFVDITNTIDLKIKAFNCYDIEMREEPHPRSEYGIRSYASFRGLASGLRAAEGFRLLRANDFGVRV
jgi:N-acetylglucosamine malate deacetylase 1